LKEPPLNKKILSCPMALFTGAGASVPLGLPDSKTFISHFEGQLGNSGLGQWLRTARAAVGEVDAEVLLDQIDD